MNSRVTDKLIQVLGARDKIERIVYRMGLQPFHSHRPLLFLIDIKISLPPIDILGS